MTRRRTERLALLVALATPGCMTLIDATASDPHRLGIYGGTRTYLSSDTAASHTQAALGAWLIFPIDLPLSLIADTLFLPITVPFTLTHLPPPPTPIEAAGERVAADDPHEASVDDLLLVAGSDDAHEDVRVRAIGRLRTHPEARDRAIPVLVEVVRRDGPWPPRAQAAKTLDGLGAADELDPLIPALLAGAPPKVAADVGLAAALGKHPRALLATLRGEGAGAVAAARVLGTTGSVDGEGVRALIDALDDGGHSYPGSWQRERADAAAAALAAQAPTQGLRRLLLEAGRAGPIAARVRIVALVGARPSLTPEEEAFLLAALQGGPPEVRRAAAAHLDGLSPARRLPALVRALDEDGNLDALTGLAALGPAAAPAAPSIEKVLGDPRAHEAACAALGAIGAAARPAVPALIASVDLPGRRPLPVVEALGKLGGPAAARFLLGRLSTSDPRERDAALAALVAADPRCEVTGRDLIALVLDHGVDWERRVLAVHVLDRAGANQPEVLAALDQVAFDHYDGWSPGLCYEAREAHRRLQRLPAR
jgi:uncharacterized protein YceK